MIVNYTEETAIFLLENLKLFSSYGSSVYWQSRKL